MDGLNRYFIPNLSDDLFATRHKLVLTASLSTALFSISYLIISIFIRFPLGTYLMIFNAVGFLSIPFLMKWRVPLLWLANIYLFIGSLAVLVLIFFSGGMQSPILPWLIAPPALALLIVNRVYAILWTVISLCGLTVVTVLEGRGIDFPKYYDLNWTLYFSFVCTFGIILIVVLIAMIFEGNMTKAMVTLGEKNKELEKSKGDLATLYDEILEKNNVLTGQKEEITLISEQLKRLNQKKNDLMYLITHDLKSPFASIQILTHLSKRQAGADGLMDRQAISMIGEIADKSQALIQKLLNAENFEQVAYTINIEKLDVVPIVRAVIDAGQNLAAQKNIVIHFEPDGEGDYTAFVDNIYLTQVFENLINNALKFSPPYKEVVITIEPGHTILRAIVKDQGPGIKDEEKEMLFTKFATLSNRPTGGESSSGLGLSIVKHYLELLGGNVRCESEHGKGSSFIVELPRQGKKT